MKKQRQDAIIGIITENKIKTQDDLRERLAQKGFTVTQATLSRDINELGIIKGDHYTPPKQSISPMFSGSVTSVDFAMNTVVIKCRPGMANAVCAELDSVGYKDVVGTLAGDDTIFVLMRTPHAAQQFAEKFI